MVGGDVTVGVRVIVGVDVMVGVEVPVRVTVGVDVIVGVAVGGQEESKGQMAQAPRPWVAAKSFRGQVVDIFNCRTVLSGRGTVAIMRDQLVLAPFTFCVTKTPTS